MILSKIKERSGQIISFVQRLQRDVLQVYTSVTCLCLAQGFWGEAYLGCQAFRPRVYPRLHPTPHPGFSLFQRYHNGQFELIQAFAWTQMSTYLRTSLTEKLGSRFQRTDVLKVKGDKLMLSFGKRWLLKAKEDSEENFKRARCSGSDITPHEQLTQTRSA